MISFRLHNQQVCRQTPRLVFFSLKEILRNALVLASFLWVACPVVRSQHMYYEVTDDRTLQSRPELG